MTKTPIEIDDEALRIAAEVLGTTTKKDTVNAALREVGERLVRLRALAQLGEMGQRGDFHDFVGNKAAYRAGTPGNENTEKHADGGRGQERSAA